MKKEVRNGEGERGGGERGGGERGGGIISSHLIMEMFSGRKHTLPNLVDQYVVVVKGIY